MKISVAIPTYKREKDLSECLDSILNQKLAPYEVLVIDNARDDKTKNIVFGKKEEFIGRSIKLKYIENNKENSLTVAKNIGAKLAVGELVSFLDDDVVLTKDYYQETTEFFKEKPKAIGMMGRTLGNLWETNKLKFVAAQFLGKFFLLGFNEKNKCRVLPSLGVTSPMEEKVVSCEWLSGASVYRKDIFRDFSFDENLKKYSDMEDVDFSSRIYKKYPGYLFFNPKARYIHKVSKSGRKLGKELVFMEEVYYLYLFYKLIPQSFKNKIAYIWGRVGRIIFSFLKTQFREIVYSFMAYFFCLKHLKQIKKGDLDFFNKTLL